jgi:steroid delta-isomerase-like uncharacterized protein
MDASPTSSDAAAVGRAYFEAIGRHDLDAMCACWDADGVDVLHGLVDLRGTAAIRDWFGATFAAMPDFVIELQDVLAEGEKAAVHWHITGTFTGPGKFQGMLPTGARIDLTGCDVLTVRDGLIERNDAYLNGAQMAQQLGALPATGSGQEKAMIGALNLVTRAKGLLGR